jgi:EAL domain-containing protein (putative c-di-GMP-specific phosphodiesterase class I)
MSIDQMRTDDPLLGLTFQFQPILAADGKRLLAYETLARRSLQDGTIEGPAVIMPGLMRADRIEAFTRHSLEFALARLDSDPYLPALSVNLSPRQIELPVTSEIISLASTSARRRLMIELTEDPIIDHPALPSVLHGIAALGIRIFLDDIAPGSHARLATLIGAAHGLKIDRSILPALAAEKLPATAQEMLDQAAGNGLILVAEGLEDIDLLPRLASRGITFFQGFALGEPWSEPRIARRRIVAPRNGAVMPEPELISAIGAYGSTKHN